MTTATALEAVRDCLATDATFIGWCTANLGRAPLIQVDYDEETELELEDYPFIGIISVQHSGDITQRRTSFNMRLLAAVRSANRVSASHNVTTENGQVTVRTATYSGRLAAEDLREQAIAALYRGRLGKISIGSDDMSHTYHPKFYSPFTVTLETLL
ncbi:MAG: hypothetical protein RBR03_09095 [Desulfuromonas thiophila]|jgi:hypothetical protein|nr:hypothetical protein [Desulfuromonas thiophila]MDY0398801.1 hypothetical protein [Desulfuromonas thiophila]